MSGPEHYIQDARDISRAQEAMIPLEGASSLDSLIERASKSHLVLIGDASHGTHEFYDARAVITQRLIEEHGFTDVVVESIQDGSAEVNQSVRLVDGAQDGPDEVLLSQREWPSIWSNTETVVFTRWLREHNSSFAPEDRVGWHGLDPYPFWAMAEKAFRYLEDRAEWTFDQVSEAWDAPFRGEPMIPARYLGAIATHLANITSDESENKAMQTYYQRMFAGGEQAAAARTDQAVRRLDQVLRSHDEKSRVVVWAHNTHVGDARGTDSSVPNVGQRVREQFTDEGVMLIGMAGGSGAVAAAHKGGGLMDVIQVPEARSGSVEDILSRAASNSDRAIFVFPEDRENDWLAMERGQRAIGVVYDPENEVYVKTRVGLRYDALLWFEHTTPTEALHIDKQDI